MNACVQVTVVNYFRILALPIFYGCEIIILLQDLYNVSGNFIVITFTSVEAKKKCIS